ncbi:MAG: hypothetical protein ACP5UN_00920 [Candidatus Micrarchaeia archaeon]
MISEIYELYKVLPLLKKSKKGQGSVEYIMVLSAVSIIIVIAFAMIMQLKGVALHSFEGNSVNQSITSKLSTELTNLSTT